MNWKLILTLAVVLAGCAGGADAFPFSVTVTTELSAVSTDTYDLDGATLEMVYSADTSDPPNRGGDTGFYAYQYFDVFTQTLSFTNRPNAQGDVLGLTVIGGNDPIVINSYAGLDEDGVSFDSRSINSVPALGDSYTGISIPALIITFGSQTIFPSNDTPTLEWFETILPSRIMPGIGSFSACCSSPQLKVGFAAGSVGPRYDFTNTVIANSAPEPCSLGLLALGGLACLRRRRGKAS